MKKKTANRLEWVFLITLLISFIILLSSCRSKETTIKTNAETKVDSSQNRSTSVDTQTNTQKEEKIKESESQDLQTNQSENISITHAIIKYDTNKPIDLVTGKPPIKEETYTTINKQSKEESKQSEQNNKDVSSTETIQQRVQQLFKSNTRSSLHYAAKNETKEKDGLSTTHKVLIAFGLFFLGGLSFGVFKLIKK